MWPSLEETSASTGGPSSPASVAATAPGEEQEVDLELAMTLLDRGRVEEADHLLTSLTLSHPRDGMIWLAAGLCRLRRGRFDAAAAALKMSSWLTGDEMSKELANLCEGSGA